MKPQEQWIKDSCYPWGDAEIIALLLGVSTSGRSTKRIAEELLEKFGDLRALAQAEVPEMATITGIGPERATRLAAAFELGRRSLSRIDPKLRHILSAAEAAELLWPLFTGRFHEECHIVLLDRRRRLIARKRLTVGSDSATLMEPRQIFKTALAMHASAVIVAHNHPSGDPTPSSIDREITRRMLMAGRIIGIPLLDHLIFGHSQYISLASIGDIPPWSSDNLLTLCS